jgi:hypothetical protein
VDDFYFLFRGIIKEIKNVQLAKIKMIKFFPEIAKMSPIITKVQHLLRKINCLNNVILLKIKKLGKNEEISRQNILKFGPL